MSFILDALKKSEEERLRQQNPSTLPTALPRSSGGTPTWVWALLGLLAVNLVVLAVVLLRPPAETPGIAAAPAVVALPTETITMTTPSVAESNAADSAPVQSMPAQNMPIPNTPPQSATVMTPARSLNAVPTRDQQLAAGANLPPATLNLHVFDADPTKRFVLLNGERLREGETSRDGLQVMSITPEGVVLSYGNSSFAVSIEDR